MASQVGTISASHIFAGEHESETFSIYYDGAERDDSQDSIMNVDVGQTFCDNSRFHPTKVVMESGSNLGISNVRHSQCSFWALYTIIITSGWYILAWLPEMEHALTYRNCWSQLPYMYFLLYPALKTKFGFSGLCFPYPRKYCMSSVIFLKKYWMIPVVIQHGLY